MTTPTKVHRKRLRSTQDTARKLAESGAASGTLVTADAQTQGRGRLGRPWESKPGGVYLTLVLRPRIAPSKLGTWSLRSARAVARALKTFGIRATVKKPNDVLAGGRKVAGILAEAASQGARVEWLLLGVGVNVNNEPPKGLEATSVAAALGRRVEPSTVRRRVLSELKREFGRRETWSI